MKNFVLAVKGFFMGIAEAIPGVSGGTLAFITGIYEEMLETIDTLAFMKMDERLYKFLKDKVKLIGDTSITNTHQEIAYNLNTSRVVVSRLLKKLENEGKIELHRNRIKVLEF